MKYGFLFFLFIQSYPRVSAQTGKRHEKPAFPEEKDYVVRQYTSENGYPLELASFVEEVVVFYRQWAERKGLSFSVDIPPGLFWQADRNILAIVLRNLVDNAVKYTPTGNIHITAAVQDGDIAIIIKDTGIGLPASKINELLNYPEAHHHKASSPHGYRLVAELAQLIQAGLHIESKVGKGTTITLSLRTEESGLPVSQKIE